MRCSVMLSGPGDGQEIPRPSVAIALNSGEHGRSRLAPAVVGRHWSLGAGLCLMVRDRRELLPRRSILLFHSLDSRD